MSPKSSLLELCQKNKWSHPEYRGNKEGTDHIPRFSAKVHVNGNDYQGSQFSTTKAAEYDAASKALEKLSNSPPAAATCEKPLSLNAVAATSEKPLTLNAAELNAASKALEKLLNLNSPPAADTCEKPITLNDAAATATCEKPSTLSAAAATATATATSPVSHKSLLQDLCQKHKVNLPKYDCEKEVPEHDPRFGGRVFVAGFEFYSPGLCTSRKLAEDEVAEQALEHLKAYPENINGATV